MSAKGSLEADTESMSGVLPPRSPSPRTQSVAPLKAADATQSEDVTARSLEEPSLFGRAAGVPPWVYMVLIGGVIALILLVSLR